MFITVLDLFESIETLHFKMSEKTRRKYFATLENMFIFNR